MARFRHISTKLVLVLDAGTEDGKKRRKRVTISNIREDAPTDALWELAQTLGKLLEYPVAEVRLYKEEAVEREAGDGEAPENGGVQKETDADADVARIDGGEAFPMFILRGGDRARAEYNRVYGRQAVCGGHARLLPPLPESEAANGRSPPLRSEEGGGAHPAVMQKRECGGSPASGIAHNNGNIGLTGHTNPSFP